MDFDRTIDTTVRCLDSLEKIELAVASEHDPDLAADIRQKILEDQVENLVTAFQRTSECLYFELENAESIASDQNVFQRLHDGSELWRRATSRGYEDYLSMPELKEIAIMFERRHKLSHTDGMVDQRYVDRSGDSSYQVGQRLIIKRLR